MINTEQWLDAAENGDQETIKKAVAEGFDINTADKYWNSTAVRQASINNQAEVLSFLLEQGANCHGIKVDGRTLLGWCAEHGLFEIVKLLVEKGNIDVNEDLKFRDFALDKALQENQFEIAYYLAEHHAILKHPAVSLCYVPDDDLWTFLIKDVEITQDFLNKYLVNLALKVGTRVCSCAHYQYVVKYFTGHQQSGNYQVNLKKCGENLLSAAMNLDTGNCIKPYRRNMPELGKFLQYLVNCGIDVNEINKNGMSPFLYAVEAKDRYSARCLKKLGANVKQLTNEGKCALHIAAKNEDLPMVQFLVEECKLDINAQDNIGWTPAHWAGNYNKDIQVLEYLVDERGADISIRSHEGTVPCEGRRKLEIRVFFEQQTPIFKEG